MPVQSRKIVIGEFCFWEVDQRFTRESGTLENDATIAGTNPDVYWDTVIGQAVRLVGTQWRFASAAEVIAATIEGVILDGEPVLLADAIAADGVTLQQYAILARGPALLNQGRIPLADIYGDTYTLAQYLAAVATLNIYSKKIAATANTSTQTT